MAHTICAGAGIGWVARLPAIRESGGSLLPLGYVLVGFSLICGQVAQEQPFPLRQYDASDFVLQSKRLFLVITIEGWCSMTSNLANFTMLPARRRRSLDVVKTQDPALHGRTTGHVIRKDP